MAIFTTIRVLDFVWDSIAAIINELTEMLKDDMFGLARGVFGRSVLADLQVLPVDLFLNAYSYSSGIALTALFTGAFFSAQKGMMETLVRDIIEWLEYIFLWIEYAWLGVEYAVWAVWKFFEKTWEFVVGPVVWQISVIFEQIAIGFRHAWDIWRPRGIGLIGSFPWTSRNLW